MWSSTVLVFAVTLLISQNGVSGHLKCTTGTFHDTSSPGITGCKPCSTCQGQKVMSECKTDQDTVCCEIYCASDAYLDESVCMCRQCTRTCQANYKLHGYCRPRSDAQCLPWPSVGVSKEVPSTASQQDETPAWETDQTPAPVRHLETAPVIDPDMDATPTAGLPLSTTGHSQTPRPRPTSSKHVTRSVSTSQATGPPPGDTTIKSPAAVTSSDWTRPLWTVTVVLGGIAVVAVASLLLYCKITMTCRVTKKPTRSVGVAQDRQWRMQPPLNNSYADRPSTSLDVGSPSRSKEPSSEARPGSGVPGSISTGSFGTSEEHFIRIAEWECEPVTTVGEPSSPPASGTASEGRGDNASFYPRNSHLPSMSMNNVYPSMSPSPSKVWIGEHGQTNLYNGCHVNGGVRCCHHHHVVCEQQQACHHTACMHDGCFLSSTFSIGSLGSGCTV